jgi:hypothetical protein
MQLDTTNNIASVVAYLDLGTYNNKVFEPEDYNVYILAFLIFIISN